MTVEEKLRRLVEIGRQVCLFKMSKKDRTAAIAALDAEAAGIIAEVSETVDTLEQRLKDQQQIAPSESSSAERLERELAECKRVIATPCAGGMACVFCHIVATPRQPGREYLDCSAAVALRALLATAPPAEGAYDPAFGDERLCACGHEYYRHFDGYEDNAPVGCKYCPCRTWAPPAEGAKCHCATQCGHWCPCECHTGATPPAAADTREEE